MTKINMIWRKIITSVLTILGIGTLTACYGAVPGWYSFSGRVTTGEDSDGDGKNDGIKGIKVELSKDGNVLSSETTDDDGSFLLYTNSGYGETGIIKFTDIDGEENGGRFKEKTVEHYMGIAVVDENDEESSDEFTLERDE